MPIHIGPRAGTLAVPVVAAGGGLGTPTFVAQSAGNGSGVVTVSVPTGTQDGDVLVAAYGNSNNTLGIVDPSGWTLIQTVNVSTNILRIYYRVASSEPASYDWSFASGSAVTDIVMLTYRQTSASPLDGAGTTNTGTSTSATALGITTTNDNTLLVMAALCAGTRTYSATSLDVERADVGGSGHVSLGVFDGVQVTAGASGNKTATVSSSATWGTVMAAFKPSGGV